MKFLKIHLGWIIIIILIIIPAIIWLLMMPLSLRFDGFVDDMISLGQLSGLLGTAMFALALILGARLKFFDKYLTGLSRVYVNHHRLGATAFSLLLFHPLFLTMRYVSFSLTSAAQFWLGSTGWSVVLGELSLFGLILLLVLTFFIKLHYNVWKNTHKYLGLAFFLGALHMFFIESDVSRNFYLRFYMLTLVAMGIIAYVFQTFLGKWLVKRYLYIVKEVKSISSEAVEITLSPFDLQKKIVYAPGQFVFINFNDRTVSVEQHPFSFLSAPQENTIKFGIKNLGDYTNKMKDITSGTLAKIEGPYGQFTYYNFSHKKQIWIAGGIGITPFISMAKDLALQASRSEYIIDLYYCVRQPEELFWLNELLNVSQKCQNFHVYDYCSTVKGQINAKIINEQSGGLLDKDILFCGPSGMMKSLREQFKQLGVSSRFIHSDEFSL